MSMYLVNKVCHWAGHNKDFRERLRQDPDGALSEWGLDPEEITAFKAGDVADLYRLGAHPFLMMHLNRHNLLGLDRKTHFQRIKAVLDDKEPFKRRNPARAH